jgi:hypothetical protein
MNGIIVIFVVMTLFKIPHFTTFQIAESLYVIYVKMLNIKISE